MLQPRLHLRHVRVDHGRQVERDELREEQASHHHQPQRLPRFAAGAVSDRDRHGAEHRGHRRHHDRPEADQAALIDGLLGRHAAALGLEREVDLHDRVLLDDPDQHDHADECINIQVHAEQDERDQRAESGRRQT